MWHLAAASGLLAKWASMNSRVSLKQSPSNLCFECRYEAQCVQAIATTCPSASCSAQNERSVSWSEVGTAPIRRSSSARHPRGRRHPGERELQPPAFNQHAYIDAWPPCDLHGLLPSAQFVSPARSPSQRCSATCWTSICCRSVALTSAGVLLQSLTVFFPVLYTLWCA